MTVRLASFAAAAACVLLAAPLSAQTAYGLTLRPGTDVRFVVRGSEERVGGRAEQVVGDSLTVSLGDKGMRHVALTRLTTLEVRGGRDHQRGAVIGGAALGLITAVAGGLDLKHGDISGGDFAGTMAGNIAVGALLGYAFAPRGWLHVPLPVPLAR